MDDARNLLVCCWLPCHWAADNIAPKQFIHVDGKWPAITRGMLLWCKGELGELDLDYLTMLRPSLANEVPVRLPDEYLARRARHGSRNR